VILKKSTLLGFCHRLAYAALISSLVWIFAFLPLSEGTYPPTRWGIRLTIARWLDLPIAVATQIVPCHESAIDLWFRIRCPEPIDGLERYFFNHMRIGILAYVLLFYFPAIFLACRRWWHHRRRASSSPTSEEVSGDAQTGTHS